MSAPRWRSSSSRRGAMRKNLARSRHTASSMGSSGRRDRKSTRLNSSHGYISYAVFCLKKKNYTAEAYGQFTNAAAVSAALSRSPSQIVCPTELASSVATDGQQRGLTSTTQHTQHVFDR